MAALDRGGTLAIAGIYLTDIPPLSYEKYLFQERQLRSVTSNTRQDAREFLTFAAEHKLSVTTHEYPLDAADRALADLKAGRFDGAAVLSPLAPARPVGQSSFMRRISHDALSLSRKMYRAASSTSSPRASGSARRISTATMRAALAGRLLISASTVLTSLASWLALCPCKPRPPQEFLVHRLVAGGHLGTGRALRRVLNRLTDAPPFGDERQVI